MTKQVTLLRGTILPPHMVVHEAVREWQRWKYDLPRRYATLKEMPMLVSLGFDYLCRTQGKYDPPEDAGHEQFVQQKKATDIPQS